MNQEKKSEINKLLKLAIPKDWKWSLAVDDHHSTIVLNIYSAPVDLVTEYVSKKYEEDTKQDLMRAGYVNVNPYSWYEHFDGELLKTFEKIFSALNLNNYDRNYLQGDYSDGDVGHYVDVNIGKFGKRFEVTK